MSHKWANVRSTRSLLNAAVADRVCKLCCDDYGDTQPDDMVACSSTCDSSFALVQECKCAKATRSAIGRVCLPVVAFVGNDFFDLAIRLPFPEVCLSGRHGVFYGLRIARSRHDTLPLPR